MLSRTSLAVGLLFGVVLCKAGWANVYAYTADDGSVSLSNVPTDARYQLLVGDAGPVAGGAAPAGARTAGPGPARPADRGAGYQQLIVDVARAHGLQPALLHAVVSVESGYNPKAVSGKGAVGLMQLMPQTARRYGVADSFDPRQNLEGGARYLRDLLRLFDNDISLTLAAYNAGEHAVVKHGYRVPPYAETLRYVPRVLDFYQRYQERF